MGARWLAARFAVQFAAGVVLGVVDEIKRMSARPDRAAVVRYVLRAVRGPDLARDRGRRGCTQSRRGFARRWRIEIGEL